MSERVWTGQQWLLWILAIICLHFAFVFRMAETRAPRHIQSPLGIELVVPPVPPSPAGSPPLAPDGGDATLFALAHPRGFSRSAWLTFPPFHYEIPRSPEPLPWLVLPVDQLADDFTEFVQTNIVSEELALERLTPMLAQPKLPVPVVVAATTVKIEGALRQRQWRREEPLPILSEPILTNTVVRVAVDTPGRVVSAALLSSSAVARADQEALRIARSVRFSPIESPAAAPSLQTELTFGQLIFQWSRVRWEDPGRAMAPH